MKIIWKEHHQIFLRFKLLYNLKCIFFFVSCLLFFLPKIDGEKILAVYILDCEVNNLKSIAYLSEMQSHSPCASESGFLYGFPFDLFKKCSEQFTKSRR